METLLVLWTSALPGQGEAGEGEGGGKGVGEGAGDAIQRFINITEIKKIMVFAGVHWRGVFSYE